MDSAFLGNPQGSQIGWTRASQPQGAGGGEAYH